jgi:hypothetical protein
MTKEKIIEILKNDVHPATAKRLSTAILAELDKEKPQVDLREVDLIKELIKFKVWLNENTTDRLYQVNIDEYLKYLTRLK